MNNNTIGPANEKGAASLVFVLLVSLVVVASTSKVFKTVKNTQEIGTAVNAVSHAETATWSAAEAFRLYLETVDSDDIEDLHSTIPITMDPIFGSLSAENVSVVETSTDVFQVGAVFVNKHAAARSSSKLQVVYNVSSITSPTAASPEPPSVNFGDSVNVGGGIELLNNGNPVDLVVDGDVQLSGVSVNPINSIFATGKVVIGSKVEVGSIFSDDDITLANTEANIVRSMGEVVVTGSAAIGSIHSNGDVSVQASGRFEDISSLKNITLEGGSGTQGVLTAGEDILVKSTGLVDSVNAVGDIRFSNWFRVGNAVGMEDITCASQWWNQVNSLSANGSLINCPTSNGSLTAVSGQANTVTLLDPVEPINQRTQIVDVWPLKDNANYFVEYDTASARIKVTVNAVEGLPNGAEYKLGRINGSGAPFIDYLCTDVDSSGNCSGASPVTVPLCVGYSPYNRCIEYNTSTKTFSISPNTTAPGVMFFDGNIDLKNGHSITTILASGDITTDGQFVHWAANRGSYAVNCEANADHVNGSVKTRYVEAYSKHYPSNLCDVSNRAYVPTLTGNIGLAAGGVNPDLSVNPTGAYSGGNINLGASTDIIGAVLAGDVLTTGGDVKIQGIVSGGSWGESNSSHSLGGKTTIDFSDIGDFSAVEIPDMGAADPVGPSMIVADILWSRPL